MNAKEIHDHVISGFFRCLGVWLLYLAVDNFTTAAGDIVYLVFPHQVLSDAQHGAAARNILVLIAKLLAAAYFLLGAPPLLRWATKRPKA